jgi:CPA2 family monovalent cation:H+ antiporter-2
VADELVALGGAFLAAGILARMGRRVGLPTIPLFMLAGVVFGPNTPGVALVDDPHDLEFLATLGLVLLLFHLGLAFSLTDLLAGGGRLLGAGGLYLLVNVGGGFVFGLALGWGTAEALVIAGAVGVSSSAIVTKLLVEFRRLANPESRLILGIVVVQDVFLALYLALLQPVLGDAEGAADAVFQIGKAAVFLVVMATVARWGSRWVRPLVDTRDDELLTVCFLGFALLVSGVAAELGVSEAIGAFLAGLVIAETSAAEQVERLVLPLRDAFASVFFFAFGLGIDPDALGDAAVPVAAAVLVTVVLNGTASLVAARMHGLGPRATTNTGLTLLARGEFSLILATLATAAGLDRRIGPFVALYVLVLAVAGPLLAARSARLSRFLPARLIPEVVR